MEGRKSDQVEGTYSHLFLAHPFSQPIPPGSPIPLFSVILPGSPAQLTHLPEASCREGERENSSMRNLQHEGANILRLYTEL